LLLGVFLLLGAEDIGPALDAAGGHGTRGFFVAEVYSCYHRSCNWTGNFELPDGQITLRNVSFDGPHGDLHRGSMVPAIDTGGPGTVFARSGSTAWIRDLGVIIVAAIGLGLWAWFVPVRSLRRRRRTGRPASDFPMPQV
jgi:hypothetical protein